MDAYATHLPVLLQVMQALDETVYKSRTLLNYRFIETGCGYYSTPLRFLFPPRDTLNEIFYLSLDTDPVWSSKIDTILGDKIVDVLDTDQLEEVAVRRLCQDANSSIVTCLFIDHLPTYSRGNLLRKVLELCQELLQDGVPFHKLPVIVCHDSSDTQYGWDDALFNQFPIRYTYTALYPHTTVVTFNDSVVENLPESFQKYRR